MAWIRRFRFLIIFLVLLTGLILSAGQISKFGINHWCDSQSEKGYTCEVKNIDIHWLDKTSTLNGISFQTGEQAPIVIGQIKLSLPWLYAAVFEQHYEIDSVAVSHVHLVLKKTGYGYEIQSLPVIETEKQPTEENEQPATFALSNFSLSNLQVLIPGFSDKVHLKQLELSNLDSRQADNMADLAMQAAWQASTLSVNGKLYAFSAKDMSSFQLKAQHWNIADLQSFIPDKSLNASGMVDVDAEIQGNPQLSSFIFKGNIAANQLQLAQDKLSARLDQLNTTADLSISPDEKSPEIWAVKGSTRLDAKKITATHADQSTSIGSMEIHLPELFVATNAKLSAKPSLLIKSFSARQKNDEVALQQLNWQGAIKQNQNTWQTQGSLQIKQATQQFPDLVLSASQSALNWTGTVEIIEQEILASGAAKIADLSIQSNNLTGTLSQIQADAVSWQKDKLDMPLAVLSQSQFSDGISSLAFDQLKLQSLSATPDLRQIKQLDIEAMQLALDSRSLHPAPSPQMQQADADDKAQPEHTSDLAFILDQMNMTGKVTWLDHQIKMKEPLEIDLTQVSLKDLDTTGNKDLRLDLLAKIDQQADLKVQISGKPLAQKPQATLVADLQALDVISLGGYLESVIHQPVKTGQLNSKINLTLNDRELKGTSKWVLNKFYLADNKKSAKQNQESSDKKDMPLDTALNLLRDDQNNIKLTLPIAGNLDNPDIDIQDAIDQAVAKAVKAGAMTYLVASLQPYGSIVLIASAIEKQASKLSLEPMYFAPGTAELTDKTRDYANKISELLKKRPEWQVTLCGQAFKDEISRKTDTEKKPDKTPEQAKIPIDEQLTALAKQRASLLRDTLTNEFGVDNKQLIRCEAKVIDITPEKIAGVVFTF